MLEDIFKNVSALQLVSAGVVLLVLYRVFSLVAENYKISRLGERAPVRPSYLPFGIDTAAKSLKNLFNHNFLPYITDGTSLISVTELY
jgi:hypothetical protein